MAAAALLACCAVSAPAQIGTIRDQPQAPSQPAQQPTGTGRISGQVVAADSGAPVKRAQVMLTGGIVLRPAQNAASGGTLLNGMGAQQGTGLPPGMVRKQAETDDSGRFDFTDLPAGQYSVSLLMPPVGFVRPERPESVRLADGQTATLTIRLGRTGAITGRVLDESGEPLPHVSLRATRRDTGGRILAAGMGGPATTDDLGVFRLYGLPPGDYYVSGSFNGPQMSFSIGGVSEAGPRMGYGPTYYPGSATLEGARRVTVRSGQDTPGIEFAMQRVPLARIVGTAVDSTGRSLANRTDGARGSVMISSHDEPTSARGSGFRPDGTFELSGLAPGEYELFATLTSGTGPDAQREAVSMPVTVNGADQTVNLQTNTGATLVGRVIVEGNDTTPQVTPGGMPVPAPRMTVSTRYDVARASFGTGMVRPAQVADDGTFELKGVRGTVFLFASGGRGVLKSVSRAGQDITTRPMTLQGTERVTDLQIVMTTETGFIHGVVTDSNGEPATAAWVLIFPDDPERWFPQSPFVTTMRTRATIPPVAAQPMAASPGGQSAALPGQANTPRWAPVLGGFTVGRLLPGRYFVAAVGDTGTMPPTDRESLEKLRATATTATVTTSEPAIVNLRMAK